MPNNKDGRAPHLVAALLSNDPDPLAEVLKLAGFRVEHWSADQLSLFACCTPDALVADSPLPVSMRRLGLLIRQMQWARPDSIVMMAGQGRSIEQKIAAQIDLIFPRDMVPAQLAASFVRASWLLRMTRLGQGAAAQKPVSPNLFHTPWTPRNSLFAKLREGVAQNEKGRK